MIRRTSATVRLSAWSRLQPFLDGRAHGVLGCDAALLRGPLLGLGRRGIATGGNLAEDALRLRPAVSTVQGEPYGPMVTLRSGAARPRRPGTSG